MGDAWDPFADPAEASPDVPPDPPSAGDTQDSKAATDLDAQLLDEFSSGRLASLVEAYRQVMRSMPNGPAISGEGTSRVSGEPSPHGAEYLPMDPNDGRPRLALYGDSITQGSPFCLSAPFCAAIAQRNADTISVENAGWGGLMAVMMSSPSSFPTAYGPLPLPRLEDLHCEYLCILIGTNDAMCMCAPEVWTDLCKSVKGPANQGPSGSPKLPEDWREVCCPSTESFERSLRETIRSAKAASGVQVAIATPPMLGEVLQDSCAERRMRASPSAVLAEMAASVRRVAASQECAVLPLQECMRHHLQELQADGRQALPWTPAGSGKLMMERVTDPKAREVPLEDLGEQASERPALCYDLVHFNESGGAIYAALVQRWLDAQLG